MTIAGWSSGPPFRYRDDMVFPPPPIDGAPVAEYMAPSVEQFRETIYPAAQPAILRGVAKDWPIVRLSGNRQDLAAYCRQHGASSPIDILRAPADIGGRFFYSSDLSGYNFVRDRSTLAALVDRLAAPMPGGSAESGALFMEATPVATVMPGLLSEHRLPHAPPQVDPMLWIGNGTTVQTHFDLSQNIACVLSGRRRFTLFPPQQTANLYMGPIERTPSGTPVSMVPLEGADLARFPLFAEARRHAQIAELEAGDALFIPYMWWHHAQAFGPFNILMNYWWNEHADLGSPMEAMLHAILTLRDLPEPMRDAWRAMFDEFVFLDNGPTARHLPDAMRGGLGTLEDGHRKQLWHALFTRLSQHADRLFGRTDN